MRSLVRRFNLRAPAHPPGAWPWCVKVFSLGRFEVQVNDVPLRFEGKTPRRPLALLKVIGHDLRQVDDGYRRDRHQLLDADVRRHRGQDAERGAGSGQPPEDTGEILRQTFAISLRCIVGRARDGGMHHRQLHRPARIVVSGGELPVVVNGRAHTQSA